jgi:hypothetical protein
MVAGVFSVATTATTGSLSVDQFYVTPPATPGNVGVSLSGGGSRALTAGTGQVRALNRLTANGRSLLARVLAGVHEQEPALLPKARRLALRIPSAERSRPRWRRRRARTSPMSLVHAWCYGEASRYGSPLTSGRCSTVNSRRPPGLNQGVAGDDDIERRRLSGHSTLCRSIVFRNRTPALIADHRWRNL